MVDVTITSTAVQAQSQDSYIGRKTAQVSITAGQAIYADASNNGKANLADADVAASAQAIGIALNSAGAGQEVSYLKTGGVLTADGFTKGTPYFVSTTAGGIAPHGDLASGDYVTLLGVATSTTTLKLNIDISGITI